MMSTGRTRPWADLIRQRRRRCHDLIRQPQSGCHLPQRGRQRGRLWEPVRVRRDLVEWAVPAACGALIGVLLDGLNRLINAMG